MEDNQVYELFENLLKQLVIHKPDHPLDFLINRLSKSECKSLLCIPFLSFCETSQRPKFYNNHDDIARRIFIVGPPGSNRKENALALAEHFNWESISIGDLLKKEVSKKSEFGKAITESLKNYRYGKLFRYIIFEL